MRHPPHLSGNSPTITIGLPVLNGQEYLQEAVESILCQTFEDFELIISDNASTDGTREICEEFAKHDRRVTYKSNDENLGARLNYNKVFSLARSEYFKWAAHDDKLDPCFIERCLQAMQFDPSVVLCYPKTRIIDARGHHVGTHSDVLNLMSESSMRRFHQTLFRHTAGEGIFIQALKGRVKAAECNAIFGIIRTAALQRTRLIGCYAGSDQVLLAELALHGKFFEYPEYLFLRRDHANTSIRANTTPKAILTWFDPASSARFHCRSWRWVREYLRAIARAPLSNKEKNWCRILWAQWVLWNWRTLSGEALRLVVSELRHTVESRSV